MGWLYVPELAASISESPSPSPTIAPSLTWRGKPLPPRRWPALWRTVPWLKRLSGTIFSPSTADAGVEQWISSLRVSRVSRGASLASGAELRTTDGSGRESLPLFATLSRGESFWRTCQVSLTGEREKSSETWPRSGSMRSGTSFLRPRRARHIAAIGSSFWPTTQESDWKAKSCSRDFALSNRMLTDWPTPQAHDTHQRGNTEADGHYYEHDLSNAGENWPTPKEQNIRDYSPKRDDLASIGTEWQTPQTDSFRSRSGKRIDEAGLDRQAKLWATPMAADDGHKVTIASHQTGPIGQSATFSRQAERTFAAGGPFSDLPPICYLLSRPKKKLSPRFAEWMMGLPTDWSLQCDTELTDYGPVVTAWFRSQRRMLSSLLRDDWG